MSEYPYNPAQTSQSRVFIIDGRAHPDHEPDYNFCLKMMGISQGFGDIERVEGVDPNNYEKFMEIAQIRGSTERVTTSLEGRYARDLLSTLLTLARKKCAVDVQLHLGICTDPGDFNTFTKALILENAFLTSWSTEDMGALSSDENAVVNETVDISAEEVYEVRPIVLQTQADTTITNEVLDVVICDSVSCGECEDLSDGCEKIYALTASAGGSPGTAADIVFTVDKGENWYAHDIDTLGAAEEPNALDCVGDYIVVVSHETNSIHYAPKADFTATTDPEFVEIATGFVASSEPRDIYSLGREAFIVGDGGYVYWLDDVTAGVTAIDAGEATVDDLYRVHALSDQFAVAVGENGVVIYTENRTTWSEVTTRPAGHAVTLQALWVKSRTEWYVGTSDGHVYYTLDKGETWTEKTFYGSGAGAVWDVVFATDSVAYISHATATPAGRILRSYDGLNSTQVLPEGSGTIPANDRVNRLAVCGDANFIVGGGLADDATDGVLMLGQAS